MYDPLKAYEKIKQYEVISFDIFDTLVKRNVTEPNLIFDIVEKKYNHAHPKDSIHGFREKRSHAERMAHEQCNREEVTFEQIYEQLDLPPKICCELMKLEADTELQYCQPDYILKDLYDRCVAEGHIVVITSDMYLPQETIIKILEKCGYTGYKKLYLSSDVGLRKRSGSLFEYLKHDLNVPAKKIVHIGDSKRADNLTARFKGIGSLYIKRNRRNTNILKKKDIFGTDSVLFSFLNNNLPMYRSNSDLFQWGYEAFGPLLLGFVKWVHEQIVENGVEKAYFLARDMFLVIDIYSKVYGSESVKYLEVSRRSLRAAYVREKGDLNAVFDTMSRRKYTIEEVLTSLNIDFGMNEIINLYPGKLENYMSEDTVASIGDAMLSLLDRYEDCTKDYLEQMGLFNSNRMAIIDIGWHGTIQNMLETLIGKSIIGLYFGTTVRNYFRKMDMHGYWFSDADEWRVGSSYLSMTFLLEVMLFPQVGTTIGYLKENGMTVPQYSACEMQNYDKVEQFQNGARAFVEDYLRFDSNLTEFSKNDAIVMFQRFAFYPTLSQAKTLADLTYEDGKIFGLATAHSIRYYLFHPVCFVRDYKGARWKEGFIKQVEPYLLPVHRIATLGKKIHVNGMKRKEKCKRVC